MSEIQPIAQETNMIRIRSVNEYFKEFAVNGIGKGQPVDLVKQQIIDAFRKEIFDQIMWKLKVGDLSEAPQTPENEKIVENIMRNSYKKWLSLIKLFNKYRETLNVLMPEDLQLLDEQREQYDPFDGFDDEEETEESEEELDDEETEDGGMAVETDSPGQEETGDSDTESTHIPGEVITERNEQ